MSWRDQLLPASLDGVGFFVDSHEAELGRRVALHEYPLRDQPYPEDLGRKARSYTIEAYVLATAVVSGVRGDDYFATRDAIARICETGGAHQLIHPYLGALDVVVLECRLRESTAEGGMARFTLTLLEAGAALFPSAVADTTGAVEAACDAAAAEAEADFAERFEVVRVPAYVADSATAKIEDFISQVRKQQAKIARVGNAVTSFSAQLDRLGDSVSALIREPANLAADVVGVTVAFAGITADVNAALRGYRALFDFGDDDVPGPQTTSTRALEQSNRAALNALVQRAATIEAARTSATVEYASYQDALEVRDAIAEQLDNLMDDADDKMYAQLAELRAAVVRDITARGADLDRIVSYTPGATLPALVLAHALYGDATRDAEIAARNRLRHPGFVQGGQAIEVLADV